LIFRGLGGFFTVFHPFFTPYFSRKLLISSRLSKTHGHKRRHVVFKGVQIGILRLEMKDLDITLGATEVKK
jgi:hypothetical protein